MHKILKTNSHHSRASRRVPAGLLILLIGLILPSLALAEAPVSINTEALIEVKVPTQEGRLELKRVPATKVLPGKTVIFVNTISNNSETPAENIVLNNPVPDYVIYIDESATGANTSITFSVDGGEIYDLPANLMVSTADGQQRRANAEDYTHIRWQLNQPLAPQATVQVEFQAKVK